MPMNSTKAVLDIIGQKDWALLSFPTSHRLLQWASGNLVNNGKCLKETRFKFNNQQKKSKLYITKPSDWTY